MRAEREKRPCQIQQLSSQFLIAPEEQLVDVPFRLINTIFLDMQTVGYIMYITCVLVWDYIVGLLGEAATDSCKLSAGCPKIPLDDGVL